VFSMRRGGIGTLSAIYLSTMVAWSGGPAAAADSRPLYTFNLPHGQSAVVFPSGVAQVFNKDHTKVETRLFPTTPKYGKLAPDAGLADKGKLLADLAIGPKTPFAADTVIVVFRAGVSVAQDVQAVDQATLLRMRVEVAHQQLGAVPAYTNDATANRVLATLGVDRSERLFRQFNRSALGGMVAQTQSAMARSLDFSNAYRLHITGASVRSAVSALLKLPSVEYASPDWHVESLQSPAIPVPQQDLETARRFSPSLRSAIADPNIPTNYTVVSSAQSMLNAPSDDDIAAYDEIAKATHELPGQGELITNVSLGDLDDASTASNKNDPCNFYASVYGPTTEILGGQRYLNLPSMPLIPTYTADANGNLAGSGEVCGVDPYDTEVDLDFGMMAPLPHNRQRGGEQGSGLTDLFGVAPGANYRLVVPASSNPTLSDIDAAFLAAAMQSPRPNVITASLGIGEDIYGFPSRYLEDDPLTEAIIAALVKSYDIAVCVAAGDGTRNFTFVAIGPRGGSAATNTVPPGGNPTNLNDVAFSTVPSEDFDSGSIDVGGTTLDDIFAAPPQDPQFASLRNQHAFAETRWTGFTNFSTGFGSRVNLSAPSDNVLSFQHAFGGADDAVNVVLVGGTSASAPQAAAAAAVVLQLGRLAGRPFRTVAGLRNFLEANGSAVQPVTQQDKAVNIGPRIDLRRAVETIGMLRGVHAPPAAPRVAVEQRQNFADLNSYFLSATDPGAIDLQSGGTDANELAWITIAPDWEGLPDNATFSLFVHGKPSQKLATTSYARLLPKDILGAAGLPLASPSNRTVELTYAAYAGRTRLTDKSFSLTFGPADATTQVALAPTVPSVITGPTIPVTYDLSKTSGVSSPMVVVSEPGRTKPGQEGIFHPAYTAPLPNLKGTVNVPVSALQGGGIYGIGIQLVGGAFDYSDFAFARVAPAPADRPAAPTLSYNGSAPGHYLVLPYNGTFQLNYDVRNVPGATGALLEISAAGPTGTGIYNPFNNPNGSIPDHNGIDSGSLYLAPLSGTSGTITLKGLTAKLIPTLNEVVRVIPMKFGGPAGEASDVSSIAMDGVAPSDHGVLNFGFGVNELGNDGFITSNQTTAAGEFLGSVQTFDQTTNSIVDTVVSNSKILEVPGWGIFGNDLGLFQTQTYSGNSLVSITYNLLNPVTSGTVGVAWTPPEKIVLEGGPNQINDIGAFFAQDYAAQPNDQYRVFTSKIRDNTFGPVFDVSGPIKNFGLPVYTSFGENTTTNTGVLGGIDFYNICSPPTIVTVDLRTGKLHSMSGVGSGFAKATAIDSATNKVGVPTLCDNSFGIYDLAAKTATKTMLPGGAVGGGYHTAADQKAHQFVVEQPIAPDFYTNNNSLSQVLVLDESGKVLKAEERFNFLNTFSTVNANDLQLNVARRSGYAFGPFQQQLEPFSY